MWNYPRPSLVVIALLISFCGTLLADWPAFRGPNGDGVGQAKDLPVKWEKENILWKTKLDGPGACTPVVVGDKIFVTAYSGYGTSLTRGFKDFNRKEEEQDQKNLQLHLICINAKSGEQLWKKDIKPKLPEFSWQNFIREHGYASSTPASDGKAIYAFFGKSGVYAFDLDGKELWSADVGEKTHDWGTAASVALSKNTVLINAAIESGSFIGLDKKSGKEVWRKKDVGISWASPVVVKTKEGKEEAVLSAPGVILGIDPDKGDELWRCDGIGTPKKYTISTPAVFGDLIFAMGAGPGMPATIMAVRAGGKGDVTKTHVLWKEKEGAGICTPVVDGELVYWVNGRAYCREMTTGKEVYNEVLSEGMMEYPSAVLADGKIFAPTRNGSVFVYSAGKKFEKLAQNEFDGDKSMLHGSPAVSHGRLYLRSNEYLYCVGKK